MLKSNGEKELLIFLFIFFLTLQPLNPILDDNKKFGHFERLSTVPHARASDTRRHHQRQFRNTEQRVDRRDDTRWKRFLALYAWLFVVQGVRANLLTCTGESLAVCLHARTHARSGGQTGFAGSAALLYCVMGWAALETVPHLRSKGFVPGSSSFVCRSGRAITTPSTLPTATTFGAHSSGFWPKPLC